MRNIKLRYSPIVTLEWRDRKITQGRVLLLFPPSSIEDEFYYAGDEKGCKLIFSQGIVQEH